MRKLEYLDALKQALVGLPPETQAKTLAYYEQRFVDGLAAGRSEEDVGRELDDPRKIAMTLRANAHLGAFKERKNPANLVRMLVAGVGLAVFNLFMVVPAAVYMALLAALYACSLALYAGGIAVTASGLAGANEMVINGPLHHVLVEDGTIADEQTRVTIDEMGIQVHRETTGPASQEGGEQRGSRALHRAEAMAASGIHISTDMDAGGRTTQALFGLGMVFGGIVLFLLALLATRFTVSGLKRYIQMNFSLLRGS